MGGHRRLVLVQMTWCVGRLLRWMIGLMRLRSWPKTCVRGKKAKTERRSGGRKLNKLLPPFRRWRWRWRSFAIPKLVESSSLRTSFGSRWHSVVRERSSQVLSYAIHVDRNSTGRRESDGDRGSTLAQLRQTRAFVALDFLVHLQLQA